MNIKKNKYIYILIFIIILVVSFFEIKNSIGNTSKYSFIKNFLSEKNKEFIKEKFFNEKILQKRVKDLEQKVKIIKREFISLNSDLINRESSYLKSSISNEKLRIIKAKIPMPWVLGAEVDYTNANAYKQVPTKAFYMERYNNHLIVFSNSGDSFIINEPTKSFKNEKPIKFNYIENNLDKLILSKEYKERYGYGPKDLKVIQDYLYLSTLKEVKKNCFTVSILRFKLPQNFDNEFSFNFENYFQSDQCKIKNAGKDPWRQHQSGGRIVNFDEDYLILTTGDFNYMETAQSKENIFGKIIKINKNDTNDYQIISLGHRNVQGLSYNKNKNYLISTEHGPKGGDEININNLNKIENFGWPISAYGVHYDGKERSYAPLHQNHIKYGYKEPAKFFNPAIGISEIIEVNANNETYLLTSLKAKTIFFVKVSEKQDIDILNEFKIGERIRDIIKFDNKNYIVALEESPGLALITLK